MDSNKITKSIELLESERSDIREQTNKQKVLSPSFLHFTCVITLPPVWERRGEREWIELIFCSLLLPPLSFLPERCDGQRGWRLSSVNVTAAEGKIRTDSSLLQSRPDTKQVHDSFFPKHFRSSFPSCFPIPLSPDIFTTGHSPDSRTFSSSLP